MGVCWLLESSLLLGGCTLVMEKLRTLEAPWQGGDDLAQAQPFRGEGCWAQPSAGS